LCHIGDRSRTAANTLVFGELVGYA
jgi:hypothetical protein